MPSSVVPLVLSKLNAPICMFTRCTWILDFSKNRFMCGCRNMRELCGCSTIQKTPRSLHNASTWTSLVTKAF